MKRSYSAEVRSTPTDEPLQPCETMLNLNWWAEGRFVVYKSSSGLRSTTIGCRFEANRELLAQSGESQCTERKPKVAKCNVEESGNQQPSW
jgi:hypothetical protein